jgi:hypothetical protein
VVNPCCPTVLAQHRAIIRYAAVAVNQSAQITKNGSYGENLRMIDAEGTVDRDVFCTEGDVRPP